MRTGEQAYGIDSRRPPPPGTPLALLPAFYFSAVGRIVPTPPETIGGEVRAVVNHGRWLVECPTSWCEAAQLAFRNDQRFFCHNCHNIEADGHWLKVIWPRNAAEIERVLDARSRPENRNWTPGETLAQLRAENEQWEGAR